ncbi:palmitoyl-protein thioesterase 1-like [Trifolium pratense]|uniref:Palmitoyl-protein thioesterase 1-like n=1 Tax=Trifolium pratense TaxID=57577 RepID=A0A2K3NKT7_TRIPR|nr:palmitoyl-protein thioesterase 1-like [Trifolium pratense]
MVVVVSRSLTMRRIVVVKLPQLCRGDTKDLDVVAQFMFPELFGNPVDTTRLAVDSSQGIGDQCKNGGIKNFVKLLSDWSGSQGYCLEIGNGMWTSWTKPLLKQTAIACEKVVKKMSDLTQGYNIVGLSQGNVIGRGIIEFCDGGPPVKNFISLGGPHAGTASIPFCGESWVLKTHQSQVEPYGHSSKSTYRVTNRLPIKI